jgi:primosomal protein N' (replication factor Y)
LSVNGDVEGFYDSELEDRRLLGFPPYSRLFRVTARGPDENRVRRAIQSLAGLLVRGGSSWELLGPAECALGKIAGNFRRHIILRAVRFDDSHAALAAAIEATDPPRGVHFEIDVDPVSLL